MMNDVVIVETQKREGARRPINPFLVERVGLVHLLSGLPQHVQLTKLRTRTIILTGLSPTVVLSGHSQVVLGQKTYDVLSDEAVRIALEEGQNIDMRD